MQGFLPLDKQMDEAERSKITVTPSIVTGYFQAYQRDLCKILNFFTNFILHLPTTSRNLAESALDIIYRARIELCHYLN